MSTSMIGPGAVIEGYEFLEKIGEGGYSTVYKVRSQKFDRIFVAKVTRVKNENLDAAWQAFDREMQALLVLDHPNIIRLYGHFRRENDFVLILEYLPNGSVVDRMRKTGAIYGNVLIRIIKEVCGALLYAWSMGIQHRDVKPANIMFDENGRAKLVDFGISMRRTETDQNGGQISDFKCSPICAAPEIINTIPYDPIKSDIWAVGITILWMAKGAIPWTCDNRYEMMQMIRYGQYDVPEDIDVNVLKMTKGMLAMAPENRIFPTRDELRSLGVCFVGIQPQVLEYETVTPTTKTPSHVRIGQPRLISPLGLNAARDMKRASASSVNLTLVQPRSGRRGGVAIGTRVQALRQQRHSRGVLGPFSLNLEGGTPIRTSNEL